MLIQKKPEVTEKRLVLGDYVTVHVPASETNQAQVEKPFDMQVHREELFKRIEKQRGVFLRKMQKQGGKLIDVRRRGVA
jgi:sRNA-binding carbon storage regulator CsrA